VSFVNVAPETVSSSAGDLDGLRSALNAANAAAAPPTTGIAPPAMDQVSAAITAALGTHALEYQTVSAQVADFHAQFVGALNSTASQYLTTEAANAEQSLLNAVTTPAQALLGHSLLGAATGTAGAVGGTGSPAVAAGCVPAAGTGEPAPVNFFHTDNPSGPARLALIGAAGLATGVASLTPGALMMPAEMSLGVGAIAPYLATATALESSGAAIGNALSGSRAVAAVSTLAHTPGNIVKAFLHGQETPSESFASSADLGVNVPVAGLLGPASEGPSLNNDV
jgi:PE family